jgi:hypothetical protein
MRQRAVRVVPHKAITVAIENPGWGRSYGVVANISTGGACVLTDARFLPGESLQLQLSFFREQEMVPAAGRVVWSTGSPANGALRYGLEWMTPSYDPRLQSLIDEAGSAS